MDWHRQLHAVALVLAAAALGGCVRDTTSPSTVVAPRLAVSGTTGSYLVLFKSGGVPADFGTRVRALGGSVTFAHGPTGIALVAGIDVAGAASLGAGKDVADVEPDLPFTLNDVPATADVDAATSGVASQSNPAAASRYAYQWNMRAIHADQAWAAGKLGNGSVTVAILDTGIDYDAPDLNGLVDLSRSASFIASDDTITWTYFPTRNVISDYHGHGTNVATQVSSKAAALAGVTSKTTLIGVKVLSAHGGGSLGSVLGGLLFAADHGADVANMSLGGGFTKSDTAAKPAGFGPYVAFINSTLNRVKQKGMLVVVAAGNEEQNLDHDGNFFKTYCGATQVLCVSAVGPTLATGSADLFAFYSNYGRSEIGVAAPGGNGGVAYSDWPWSRVGGPYTSNDAYSWVWSYCSKTRLVFDSQGKVAGLTACSLGNRITGYIGTSQAAPHVTGLAASLVAEGLHGQPSLLKQRIQASADDLGQPGTDPFYGRGRINVARALGL